MPIGGTPFARSLVNAEYDSEEDVEDMVVGGSSTPLKASTPLPSVTPSTPRKRKREMPSDRYVPNRDNDLRTQFNIMSEAPSTPARGNRIIPSESDALKEQANATFNAVLSAEFDPTPPPPSPQRPASVSTNNSDSLPSTPQRRRLFMFSSPTKTAEANPGLDSFNSHRYSASPVRQDSADYLLTPKKTLRTVSKTPFRVLDAPDLTDDFYLNLVDWSSDNVLGVGLGASVYLWTAHTANVTKLCELSGGDTVTSLNWMSKDSNVAVGTLSGKVYVWDAHVGAIVNTFTGHSSRIGALAWHENLITSGSRDRSIMHHDIRAPPEKSAVRTLKGHRQEVCGLKWNESIGQLASGGNDNKLMIWDLRSESTAPLWKFHEHTAAVKAIAWNPHVAGVLASGGGSQDKKMRFWNTLNGTMIKEMDTGSQVCNLTWSRTSQELVSTHGYSSTQGQNQICIWKYPSMDMVATLSGHTHRVLYLAMSPDGQTIVTGAGDETLRFWNAFPKAPEDGKRQELSRLDMFQQIR